MEITKDECIRLLLRVKDTNLIPRACRDIGQHVQEIHVTPDDPKQAQDPTAVLHDLRQRHPNAIIRRSTTTRGKYYKLSKTAEHQETCAELAKRTFQARQPVVSLG